MAVVKADAYGHGAVETAKALVRQGVHRLAVVSIEEGIALRHADIQASILVLGPLFPEQVADLLEHRLIPVISDLSVLPALARATAAFVTAYPVHLKIDTGMGRLGLTQQDFAALMSSNGFPASLHLEGLMTHLADTDGASPETTDRQLKRFSEAIDTVTACGLTPLIHAANSGGAVRFPQARFSLIRPGIMLYGYHTLPKTITAPSLKAVLSLTSRVAQLRTLQTGATASYNGTFTARRTTHLAILPIGYADGVNRRLSNRGHVLLHGERAPMVGLVCMDMILVDVTGIPGVAVGDEAILIGRQGQNEITASDIAGWLGTIPYEVLCSIGPRIPRRYQHA